MNTLKVRLDNQKAIRGLSFTFQRSEISSFLRFYLYGNYPSEVDGQIGRDADRNACVSVLNRAATKRQRL